MKIQAHLLDICGLYRIRSPVTSSTIIIVHFLTVFQIQLYRWVGFAHLSFSYLLYKLSYKHPPTSTPSLYENTPHYVCISMNALKCKTLTELLECVSISWLDGGRSFIRHQISLELVNFGHKFTYSWRDTHYDNKQSFKETKVSISMFYADIRKSEEISRWGQIKEALHNHFSAMKIFSKTSHNCFIRRTHILSITRFIKKWNKVFFKITR